MGSTSFSVPVLRIFPAVLFPSQLITIAQALGCHVACKLDIFGSDERTLTDDLCDMFLIWSQIPPPLPPNPNEQPINVVFRKSTQDEESREGFDLSLRVISPLGQKKALLQSKVLDPDTLQLRVTGKAPWKKLRKQLLSMKALAPGMYFLMLYVPARDLDGAFHHYPTYEQGFYNGAVVSAIPRAFGTTVIAGDLLLTGKRNTLKKVQRVNPGVFTPAGITMAKLLGDMLLCNIGVWSPVEPDDAEKKNIATGGPRFAFTIDFSAKSNINEWRRFEDDLRASLKGLQ